MCPANLKYGYKTTKSNENDTFAVFVGGTNYGEMNLKDTSTDSEQYILHFTL